MKYADTQPRKNVGSADFQCPNCNKEHQRTLWQEGGDMSFVHADALCSCGAQILVADTLERFEVYWLNEKKMQKGEGEGLK